MRGPHFGARQDASRAFRLATDQPAIRVALQAHGGPFRRVVQRPPIDFDHRRALYYMCISHLLMATIHALLLIVNTLFMVRVVETGSAIAWLRNGLRRNREIDRGGFLFYVHDTLTRPARHVEPSTAHTHGQGARD